MDIDTVVRACPVCRVASHFIVPSVVWYSSSKEKEDIINGYKNKLRCVHENLKLLVLFDVPMTT
jgi:E3 ubiquitin-protein ligase makorin